MRKVLLDSDPSLVTDHYRFSTPHWPARWVGPLDSVFDESVFIAYRCQFELDQAQTLRIHVSADQRYELYIDGQLLGRGPERGDLLHWMYDTFDLDLSEGLHTIVARTWWLKDAPEAQQTHRPGFLLYGQDHANTILSTGVAQWQYAPISGINIIPGRLSFGYFAVGGRFEMDASKYPFDIEKGTCEGWQSVKVIGNAMLAEAVSENLPYWRLTHAQLPPPINHPWMRATVRHVDQNDSGAVLKTNLNAALLSAFNTLLKGQSSITIPPHVTRRVMIDLDDYACVYPQIVLSGGEGSRVSMLFAESLFEWDKAKENEPGQSHIKGNRDQIEGKYFIGVGDIFLPHGGKSRRFSPFWWLAGRYVQLLITTQDESLTIESITFEETGFDYQFESSFSSSDPRLQSIIPIALRTLSMCSHETNMDCPYYEQLNYAGDTRLQSLVAMTTSRHDELAKKAIRLFDWSRNADGWTQSRYPTRTMQTIPTFCLCWATMLCDFAFWRNDPQFVKIHLEGVRAVLERWRRQIRVGGLVQAPVGWNFVDWVPGWGPGVPPEGSNGFSAVIHWQFIYTLMQVARVEDALGDPLLAKRNRDTANMLAIGAYTAFYDSSRKLYADDMKKNKFSEHAQSLAIISGCLDDDAKQELSNAMLASTDLARTTIYFTHYLFEAYHETGKMDAIMDRLKLWFDLPARGFKTTFEMPDNTRSDCHAWGAHPVYHYYTNILGIRPASVGFETVTISPLLEKLTEASGIIPHPRGRIEVDFKILDHLTNARILLPDKVKGTLIWEGKTHILSAGENRFTF